MAQCRPAPRPVFRLRVHRKALAGVFDRSSRTQAEIRANAHYKTKTLQPEVTNLLDHLKGPQGPSGRGYISSGPWGVCEGAKEDKAGWSSFLRHLKKRGVKGVELVISDACLGLAESIGNFYPQAKWQRCSVHFNRNVFSVVPRGMVKKVAMMLKAIHASEDREAADEKARSVIKKLKKMKFPKAAQKFEGSLGRCGGVLRKNL